MQHKTLGQLDEEKSELWRSFYPEEAVWWEFHHRHKAVLDGCKVSNINELSFTNRNVLIVRLAVTFIFSY